MKNSARLLSPVLRRAVSTLRDLAPIIIVIAFFQLVVLQQPFPNLGNVIVGLVCVCVGLGLFVQGLESGLFPLGEVLARGFANKGSLTAILAFAFCLGIRRNHRRAGPNRRRHRGRRGGVGNRSNLR